jgi:hypothetical protein
MNYHTVAYRTYKVEYHCAHQVPSSLAPAFKPFAFSFTTQTNQTLLIVGDAVESDAKAASCAESDTAPASSSSNVAAQKITKKDVPTLQDYWKKSMVTEADRAAYHAVGWLSGGVVSSISDLEFPTVDNTTIVCFECHLIAGLGLPPSKFLVSILNFLRCELVHLNPNTINVLSCFAMLCECWLGVAPDTSLFWYFYGLD